MKKVYVGLQLVPLPAGTPPQAGAPIGVDAQGNIVTLDAGYRVTQIADVVATNSTADVASITTTIPANGLSVGSSIGIRTFGTFTVGALGPNLTFWVKLGATKILTFTFTNSLLGSGGSWEFRGEATVRVNGANGTLIISGVAQTLNGTTPVAFQVFQSVAISTLVANAISFGFNWSAATAGSNCTATQGRIYSL